MPPEQDDCFMERVDSESILPLCVIAWDVDNGPVVAMADESWECLTQDQVAEVFRHIGGMALDFAPFMGDPEFREKE